MNTLYINTATAQTTIAIFAGSKLMAEEHWKAEMNEVEKLQPELDKLLKSVNKSPDDIQQLAVCIGPGGFTSSRIGVSAINAWAFAKNIPVAQLSVFDLYEAENTLLIISANSNEAWVKLPGKEAKFLSREQFVFPAPFTFGGSVDEKWKEYLESLEGKYEILEEQLPKPDKLKFIHEMVKPWYYKDANITWSEKIRK